MPGQDDASDVGRLVELVVIANHVLYKNEIVDGFGHVSARRCDRPDSFLLSRSMAPGLVTADDVLTFDLAGNELSGSPHPTYIERFIHAEIYRARPDVHAVVHSHSPAVIPFSVTRSHPLRPVCHMCGFLRGAVPIYEIRDHAGDSSDMLIRSAELGRSLAHELGDGTAILMRGHGSTVVGARVEQAVYRAIYLDANARLQADALRLGAVTFLTEAEAEATNAANDGQIGRAFALWKLEAGH